MFDRIPAHWAGPAVALLLAAGCAGTRTAPDSDYTLKSYPPANARQSLSCEEPCEVEWERAGEWLAAHARGKLRTRTDISILTEYPRKGEPYYGFSVVRSPRQEGGYLIKMYMGCGNRTGCDLDPARIRNIFFDYLRTGKDAIRNINTGWVSIR